jgi:hypothetical protein
VRNELPTGTVTFLFTDVEGSTRLLHELGAEAYAAALAEHRGIVFPTAPGALVHLVAPGRFHDVSTLSTGRSRPAVIRRPY